jgi:thioredoxin 1
MNKTLHKLLPVEVSEASFQSEVLRTRQPVVAAFWAPWSRPCQILDWELDEVARACAGSAKVVKVNADDNPDLSLCYDIQSVPTLLFFVDGVLHARVVGTTSRAAILARLQADSVGGDAMASTPCAHKEHKQRHTPESDAGSL